MSDYTVVEVHSITNTAEEGALRFDVTLTDPLGSTERHTHYTFRTSDPYGAAPTLWQWLLDNPEFEFQPYVPPTDEQLRAAMPPITPRQFWIAAASIGILKQDVLDIVAAIVDAEDRLRTEIEVLEATMYERTNPYLEDLANAMEITPEQMDTLWIWASDL